MHLVTHEHTALTNRTAELFADPSKRPTPQRMARLIMDGLTEDMLIDAGRRQAIVVPKMELTLAELGTVLPHIHRLSDELHAEYAGQRRLLFAARDAEALYDDHAIAYPDTASYLLPASVDLWLSDTMQGDLGRRFLGRYGMDAVSVRDPDIAYAVVDSGFWGTVGQYVDATVMQLHGIASLRLQGAMDVRMVCASSYKPIGETIIQYAADEAPNTAVLLPKTASILANDEFNRTATYEPPSHLLASSLQLMPRYHGHFEAIAEQNGEVVALPHNEAITNDVDASAPQYRGDHNGSIVNPIAASIVQRRIVLAALERM